MNAISLRVRPKDLLLINMQHLFAIFYLLFIAIVMVLKIQKTAISGRLAFHERYPPIFAAVLAPIPGDFE